MARCETCGNDYDKAFQVSMNGTTHNFDSFECAIHALAPTCEQLRHPHRRSRYFEKDGTFSACEHCDVARRHGIARPQCGGRPRSARNHYRSRGGHRERALNRATPNDLAILITPGEKQMLKRVFACCCGRGDILDARTAYAQRGGGTPAVAQRALGGGGGGVLVVAAALPAAAAALPAVAVGVAAGGVLA